ncbi:TPA: hypothetical protein QHY99_001525 [Klebsiella aerogenes]|nr:hypothetical protein [Klebsiella aerogenes]
MKINKIGPYERYHIDNVFPNFIESWFIRTGYTQPTFHRGMFDEDFSRVFYSSRHLDGRIFVVDSNDNDLVEQLLGNAQTRHRATSIDETIREMTEEIARTLIGLNKCYYFLHESTDSNNRRLAYFSGNGVFRILNQYIQLVPKRIEKYWERDDEEHVRELRLLDKNKIMYFSMPAIIKKLLSKQNRILTFLDKYQYDNVRFFPKATYEDPSPKNYFDFKVWKNSHDFVLYRATRETGWNGRKYNSPMCSDVFNCHRLLRFRKNQIIFRDNILQQLGQQLTKIGRQFNSKFYIVISGSELLTSLTNLNEVEDRLEREEITFSEIIDFCYRL